MSNDPGADRRDEPGALTPEQLDVLNDFLNANVADGALTCPVTGEQVPIAEWNAPDRVIVLPGQEGQTGYAALPLTSPAGGVVLLSAVKVGILQDFDLGT